MRALVSSWGFALLLPGVAMNPASAAEPQEVHRIPVNIFSGEPRGEYSTGTFEELWVDDEREEPGTADPADKRHLMIQIWYPAGIEGNPQRAPYILNRQLYRKEARWLDEVESVRTNSVLNAPIARTPAAFPVLIYSPGGGHPHFSGQAQTEFLASHGYVVVAIGHNETTGIERFPDGGLYQKDPERNPANLPKSQKERLGWDGLSEPEKELLTMEYRSKHLMVLNVADVGFVLDQLGALNERPRSRFHRRLDLDRVGAFGWSRGGSVALQASRDEPRIKAAVNFDGWQNGDVVKTGTSRPVMVMASDEWRNIAAEADPGEVQGNLVSFSWFWNLYGRSKADWYHLTLKRAAHGSFSDRRLFKGPDANTIHPRLVHEIINRYTLEFFDKYLCGSVRTPLLSGEQGYPEVELARKPIPASNTPDSR